MTRTLGACQHSAHDRGNGGDFATIGNGRRLTLKEQMVHVLNDHPARAGLTCGGSPLRETNAPRAPRIPPRAHSSLLFYPLWADFQGGRDARA